MECENNDVIQKICLRCPKDDNEHPICDFQDIATKKTYAMCIKCRIKSREQDEKRKGRKRNWKEELEKNPERKAKKELWNKQNKELIKKYYSESRARRKEKMGLEEYWELMAKQQKAWREKNQEKYNEIKERAKRSIVIRIGIYKSSAQTRGFEFDLTDEQCEEFFLSECKGCGEKDQDGKLCGIDRIDNDIGYIYTNCRSFCEICNFVKGTMNDECLLRKIEHILNFVGVIDTSNYYHEEFKDHSSVDCCTYIKRAEIKNLDFELSFEEFVVVIGLECYLCGKEFADGHSNGIDRINNKDGYKFGNILPCCGDCNYMKNKFQIDEFIYKIYKIYTKNKNLEKNLSRNYVENIVKDYIANKINEINDYIENTKKNAKNHYNIDKTKNIASKKIKGGDKSKKNYDSSDSNDSNDSGNINNEKQNNKFIQKQKGYLGEERSKKIVALQKKITRKKKNNQSTDDLYEQLKKLKDITIPFESKEKKFQDKQNIDDKINVKREQARLRQKKFQDKKKQKLKESRQD
jgi:hypothetical protein